MMISMCIEQKQLSIRKYIDAHLKKKWSAIYDPKYESYWIIDVKNEEWVLRLEKDGNCWFRVQVADDICELYDVEKWVLGTVIREVVHDVLTDDPIRIVQAIGGTGWNEVIKHNVTELRYSKIPTKKVIHDKIAEVFYSGNRWNLLKKLIRPLG